MTDTKLAPAFDTPYDGDTSARVATEAEAIAEEARMGQEARERRAAKEAKRRAWEEGATLRAERKANREARKASQAAKRARLAPLRASIEALAPGQDCEIPCAEYALVYRVATETGRTFKTHKRLSGMLRVTRTDKPGLGAADGLL
jgi:cytochrome c556